MKIRSLTNIDIPEVSFLLRTYFDEMQYEQIYSFSYDTVMTLLKSFVTADHIRIYVAEKNDKIIGVAGFMLTPSFMDMRDTKAIEFIWHANVDLPSFQRAKIMLKLLDRMERGAKEIGSRSLYVALDAPPIQARFWPPAAPGGRPGRSRSL